jgi:hypothetical protein
VIAFSRASVSPNGMDLNPGVKGPKFRRAFSSELKLMIVRVRP